MFVRKKHNIIRYTGFVYYILDSLKDMLDNASVLAFEISVCLLVPISGVMSLNTEKSLYKLKLKNVWLIVVGCLLGFPQFIYASIYQSDGYFSLISALIYGTATSIVTLSSLFLFVNISNTFVTTSEKSLKKWETTTVSNENKLQTCIDLQKSYSALQKKCGNFFLVTFFIYGFCFLATTFWVCLEFLEGHQLTALFLSGYPIQNYIYLYYISFTAGNAFESFEKIKNQVRYLVIFFIIIKF